MEQDPRKVRNEQVDSLLALMDTLLIENEKIMAQLILEIRATGSRKVEDASLV